MKKKYKIRFLKKYLLFLLLKLWKPGLIKIKKESSVPYLYY